jgi:bifunctional oligoribonuclease and PAP phosphatase NrnA
MTLDSRCDEVLDILQSTKRALIVAHVNPDADAYGSSCGLAQGLKSFGISVQVYNESGYVPRYAVIPGASQVSKDLPRELSADDLVIVCDCGAIERVGELFLPIIRGAQRLLNIDHHTANSLFGNANYVVDGASSTSELVFNLLQGLERRTGRTDIITEECAKCLLAGIIGDTGSFRYPSTTAATFRVAGELVDRGARPDILTQELFANHSLAAVRLQAEAMSGVVLHESGKFAEVVVTQEMLKRLGADLLDADSLAERARDIDGVRVSALYKQDVDMWRVSLRSRQGAVDVSSVAQHFGGGGHKPAAAFRWRRDLETLQRELQAKIREALAATHA